MTQPTADGHSPYVASASATQREPAGAGYEPAQTLSAAPGLDSRLQELYANYAPLVWRTLRRMGVADHLLEDGVQDVFMVVHRQLDTFQARSTIKTWIVGIAIRVAKDHRRAEVRRVQRMEHLDLAGWLTSSDIGDSPADAIERREANELMHALLAELPDEFREVLVLVELEELTIREASEAIGIRVRTGQRRLRAATNALSKAVAQYLQQDRRSCP